MIPLLLALVAQAQDDPAPPAPAEPTAEPEPPAEQAVWQKTGFGWGGLPALNYNSDEGFGYGVLASIYRYDGETSPYRWSTTLLIFLTTKQIHNHRIQLDALDLAGGKLRLTTRVGLHVTRTENYCGLGGSVSCAEKDAQLDADELGLVGKEREEFIAQYFRYRLTRPYGYVWARWKLVEDPKIEALLGYRFTGYRDGDLQNDGPFPGSLYDQDRDTLPEDGVYSVLSTGLMYDTRDFESAPSRGWWIEGTIRGSTRAFGSTYDSFGGNLTVRGYLPIAGRKLVLASRSVADGLVGDVPPRELANLGGTQPVNAYGGDAAGRGIRQRRAVGKVLLMEQAELRWWFVRIPIKDLDVDLTALGFVDTAHVAAEWEDLFDSPLLVGEGGGLRVAFNENFIIRVDAGFSAVEDYSMGLYIDVDNLF